MGRSAGGGARSVYEPDGFCLSLSALLFHVGRSGRGDKRPHLLMHNSFKFASSVNMSIKKNVFYVLSNALLFVFFVPVRNKFTHVPILERSQVPWASVPAMRGLALESLAAVGYRRLDRQAILLIATRSMAQSWR